MVVSLEEAKLYLRVDGDEEDTLIAELLIAAEEICEEVLRFPLSEFEELPKVVKQAVLYAVANIYDGRESLDVKEVMDVIKRLLFSYRKEGW